MKHADFQHVDTWVFDLDHTLYPASMALFDQINIRMSAFVMRALNVDAQEADCIRHTYWRAHGTTLAGLMAQHNIPPYPYLDEVHEIDFSILKPDPILADRITRLRGRRIVYTNGTADYARNVLHHRGLSGLFDAIYGVEDANYRPKPDPDAFAMIFGKDGLSPTRAAMFEDDPRNLAVPHELGLRTILIDEERSHEGPSAHIHHQTHDLSWFLGHILGDLD